MRKETWNQILKVAGVLAIFLALFILLNLLLQPKYMEDLVEGSMLSQYYRETGGAPREGRTTESKVLLKDDLANAFKLWLENQ